MKGETKEVKTEVITGHKYMSNRTSTEWAHNYANDVMKQERGKEPEFKSQKGALKAEGGQEEKKEITIELIESSAKSIMEQYMKLKEEINVSLSNGPSQKILGNSEKSQSDLH